MYQVYKPRRGLKRSEDNKVNWGLRGSPPWERKVSPGGGCLRAAPCVGLRGGAGVGPPELSRCSGLGGTQGAGSDGRAGRAAPAAAER